jgi:hypothetical protein
MKKPQGRSPNPRPPPPGEALFAPQKRTPVPFEFVLDALAAADPQLRPMFGCVGVYVEERIVLILRDGREPAEDNGVWLATTKEHHPSLRRELPSMRSIGVLGPDVTGWQVLPPDAESFEEEALRAVAMILAGDPRIGKDPAGPRLQRPREKAPPKVKKKSR